ncbi:MAG TPA: YciI family protein [Thermoanaerobaculia bacterium]
MAKFVLMLRDQGFPSNLSPQELQDILGRYRTWSQKAGRTGGEKLKDRGGRVMKRGSVTDGPYVESKEVIGGFMIIEANDYDDAVRLCSDHPHLDFGSIEIRQVDPM